MASVSTGECGCEACEPPEKDPGEEGSCKLAAARLILDRSVTECPKVVHAVMSTVEHPCDKGKCASSSTDLAICPGCV